MTRTRLAIALGWIVPRTYNALAAIFAVTFALGINGFIPSGSTGLTMPLWLAVLLTVVGLAGCIGLGYLRPFFFGGASS